MTLLGASVTVLAFAQMNGTSGGRMTGPTGSAAAMAGSFTGMGDAGMGGGPVVGSDGTAYVFRRSASTMMGQSTTKTELIAVNPSSGKINWSLQIDGTMVSEPVLAKDGSILVTTSAPAIGSATSTAKPSLLIIAPGTTSARVQARIPIDADVLSSPVATPDGQTIYVVASDMPASMMRNQSGGTITTYLYAFFPGTGNLKFKVQLQ